MPVRVYYDLLGTLPASSREYAALKNSQIQPAPTGDYNVETFCEVDDTELLLDRAKRFCPEAVPYIEQALVSVRPNPAGR
jgi:hypothetical protein